MAEPRKFKRVFVAAMTCVAAIFATVSVVCVHAFGEVTNGSVTAFLLEKYKDDTSIIVFLMFANTLVSFSVLFTYPLQLFPTLDLVGPKVAAARGTCRCGDPRRGAANSGEFDLTEFEPLPYAVDAVANEADGGGEGASAAAAAPPPETAIPGDSIWLRMGLVLLTYAVAVVVPNVQVLISLAGALAGSSVALLIPPLIELALLNRLAAGPVPSPALPEAAPWRRLLQCDICGEFGMQKLRCCLLFTLGFVFMLIGAGASIYDILSLWFK